MVCDKCKAKLTPLNTTAVWKDGATNTVESGSVKAKNTLLDKKRSKIAARDAPYLRKCGICKQTLTNQMHHYCQECAYKQGICSMCGRKVLDTTLYKQSSV